MRSLTSLSRTALVLPPHGLSALLLGGSLESKPICPAAHTRLRRHGFSVAPAMTSSAARFSSLWTPRGELDAPGLPAQHRCVVRTVGSFCVVAKRAALRRSVRGHAVARADIDRSSALCLVFLLRRGFRRGSEISKSRCVPSHCVAHF